jgi:hypothetical protein
LAPKPAAPVPPFAQGGALDAPATMDFSGGLSDALWSAGSGTQPAAVPASAPAAAPASAPGPAPAPAPTPVPAPEPAPAAAPSPAAAPATAANADGEADSEAPVEIAPKPKPIRESPPPKQWRCKAGKVIFQEEESSFDLFILEEGKVEIVVSEERVAVVDKPGVVLGEIGALLKRPRSAMVRALTPCTFTIYRDFEALMAHDPDKLLEVAKILAQRLADTNARIDKVFGILYQAKIREDVIDNVGLALQGKKPKAHEKSFWEKLGF